MELINLQELRRFAGASVEITVHNQQGGDQAPAIKKKIEKIEYCPDRTHVRFYFDKFNFIAVPLASDIAQSETLFSASDANSGLTYTVSII
ncbi:hypothetical protein [Neobacillus sp. DY30]|uniref:hypothetical protein n=1 Tax=Neobacillus sp. DY30 TaxID=3047871 RepID=UPI0024BF1AA7|nr:hypothetical protein [Neobacillus sp. DY30]WHY01637.1 hypothetical protein QNH29_05160 [Neobacillus sp. DY30]